MVVDSIRSMRAWDERCSDVDLMGIRRGSGGSGTESEAGRSEGYRGRWGGSDGDEDAWDGEVDMGQLVKSA